MSWLFPSFLSGALLVALPVLLHFLRSKPKTIIRFPSLRFLGKSAVRDVRKHRLRRLLTLLLRCLIISLLSVAFARPFWSNAAAKNRQVMVVAIDNSMSMQAHGRWNKLKSWALLQLEELGTGDQAALLVMHPSPTWLVPMTDDLVRVRAALQNVQPGFEKTHYANALHVAGERLGPDPALNKTLVWMADEQRAGWLGVDFVNTFPADVKIRFGETAPAAKRQAAIVALQHSSAPHEGIGATVRLFEPQQDERRIIVRSGQRTLFTRTVSLHAGDNKIDLPFAWPQDADGVSVSLDPDDSPADDTAWIVAQKSASPTVLLDTVSETDFLAHAFLSTRKLDNCVFKTFPLPEKNWPLESVVVVRSPATFRGAKLAQLEKFVDAGGPLWIFANGSTEQNTWLKSRGVQVTERLPTDDAVHLHNWDPEHPMLAAFSGQSLLPLLEVEFHHGFDLVGDTLVPLASWPDGKIAIAEWSGQGRHILLTGFPLNRIATDWPTRVSFVPFAHQAVRWLGSFGSSPNDWRVGDSIPLCGEGTWRALDAATSQPVRKASGSIRPDAPGLYEFTTGSSRKVFTVNIPPEESDLTPWPDPGQLALLEKKGPPPHVGNSPSAPRISDEVAENQQRLWWWVLSICSAAILAELSLANRTAM